MGGERKGRGQAQVKVKCYKVREAPRSRKGPGLSVYK